MHYITLQRACPQVPRCDRSPLPPTKLTPVRPAHITSSEHSQQVSTQQSVRPRPPLHTATSVWPDQHHMATSPRPSYGSAQPRDPLKRAAHARSPPSNTPHVSACRPAIHRISTAIQQLHTTTPGSVTISGQSRLPLKDSPNTLGVLQIPASLTLRSTY